jgi:hypothetical protein
MSIPSENEIWLLPNTLYTAINCGATGTPCEFVAPLRCVVVKFQHYITDAVANTYNVVLDKVSRGTASTNAAACVLQVTAANNQYKIVTKKVSPALLVNAGEVIVMNVTATGTGTRTAIPQLLVRVADDTGANQATTVLESA